MPENIAELGFGITVNTDQQPIDSLVDAVGRFETVISKVIEHIPELGAELETEMAAVRTRIDEAAAATNLKELRVDQAFAQGLGKDYLSMSKQISNSALSMGKLSAQAESADRAMREASSGLDIFDDGTKAFNDQLRILEQLENEYEKFDKLVEIAKDNHSGLYDEIVRARDGLDEYRKQLLGSKEAIWEFNKRVNQTREVLKTLGIDLHGMDVAVMKLADGTFGFWNSILHLVINALKDVIALQDDYAKASFRAAGGVNAMLDANAELQGRIGLTAQEASESVKALASAGVRAEEDFADAAVSMTKFTQTTGASSGATAQFAKSAIIATGSVAGMENMLGDLTGAMVAGGLSAEDMNSLLGTLSQKLIGVSGAYGEAAAAQYAKTTAAAAAMAKKLGIELTTLTDIMKDLSSPADALESDMLVLFARAGVLGDALDGTLDPAEAFSASLKTISDDLKEANADQKFGIEDQYRLMAVWGMSKEKVMQLQGAYKKAEKENKSFVDVMNETKAEAEANAKLNEQWAKATETLAKEFKQAVLPLIGLISKGLVPFVEIVTFALKPITLMVEAFGLISDVLKGVGEALGITNETGKAFNTVLKTLGVSVILLMSPLGMAGAAFFAIAGATKAVIEWFGITDNTTKKVISAFGLLAGAAAVLYIKNIALGLSFKGLLSWMNPMHLVKWVAGLWKAKDATDKLQKTTEVMSKTKTPMSGGLKSMLNPKTLLSLGALLLMLGGFVYILGQTAVALKEAGVSMSEFAGFMAAVVIGIGVLTAVLVGLAMVAGPVSPILLAIGAAMLMMGAAVGIAAAGIGFMAKGFATLFESLSFERVGMFAAFAGTLYLAAGGFVALGASMLAVPAIIAGMVALGASYLAFAAASRSLLWIAPVLERLSKAALGIKVLSSALTEMGAGLKMVSAAIRSMESADMKVLDSLTQGILQRRKAITDSADLIETQAQRISTAIEMINSAKIAVAERGPGEVADTAALGRTVVGEQVVQVRNITADVDRLRNQRDQEATVDRLNQMVSTMGAIGKKLDSTTAYDLAQLLEEWLPQIARGNQSSFRNERANNWMGGR